MTDLGPAPAGNTLVDRVKAILLTPKAEWPRIAAESATIGDIYKSHVIPLAAIGPVAGLIGSLAFGQSSFGITYRPSVTVAVGAAVVSYVFALVGIYLCGLVIDFLAPNFGATKNRVAAFKVAAYGATAAWVAGIFGLFPPLALLSILGLYSLYLIYLGLPVLMKAPEDKAVGYTAVVIVVMIVIGLVIAAITAPVAAMFGGGAAAFSGGTISGTVNVPGAGSVDMAKLEETTKRLDRMADSAKSGQPMPVIAPDTLQTLLPGTVGGLARTSIEGSSAGAGGINGSHAEAHYGSGADQVTLTITDMGAMGGLAALGGALNIQSSKQSSTGYERVGKVDGRMTTEKYDTATKAGTYSTIVADRVMIEAEGNAPSIDVFKAAVGSIDLAKVESLAKQ